MLMDRESIDRVLCHIAFLDREQGLELVHLGLVLLTQRNEEVVEEVFSDDTPLF